jgi:crotonobetainyl-CoA:carnitine CoA-transferase CaiB-like acyl-CoA transferase
MCLTPLLQAMGTPLMSKLGSSKLMEAGPGSHVPSPNARTQAGTNPTFNNYRTADNRWIQMLGLETPRHWPLLVECLGLQGQVPEKWYTSVADQRAHGEGVLKIFDTAFAAKTLAEWKEVFDEKGVWYQPILRAQEVVFDEQVYAVDGITPEIEHGDG